MEKVLLNDGNLIQKVLQKSMKVLRAGGVVMHPTETCYGLAVDVRNSAALEKLYKLKGRDASKPVSILVADLGMAKKYGEFSPKALELAEKYWPGPLTILVPRADRSFEGDCKLGLKGLSPFFNPGQDFVGIRCPSHEFSRKLVQAFGSPLTTTSANLSGEAPLYEADTSTFGELAGLIDLVVDGGKIPFKKPSTIVRVVGDQMDIVRQGELKI